MKNISADEAGGGDNDDKGIRWKRFCVPTIVKLGGFCFFETFMPKNDFNY